VQEDDSCFGLMCLLERKRHEPFQVAEVSRDEDDGGMSPSAWFRMRHGAQSYAKRFAPEGGMRCAKAHGDL
jgi:hypothetical protein